jgi:hypothetical protein
VTGMRLVPLFLYPAYRLPWGGGVRHGADSCTLKLGYGSRDLLFKIGALTTSF